MSTLILLAAPCASSAKHNRATTLKATAAATRVSLSPAVLAASASAGSQMPVIRLPAFQLVHRVSLASLLLLLRAEQLFLCTAGLILHRQSGTSTFLG